jgi:micrococcal nuclease
LNPRRRRSRVGRRRRGARRLTVAIALLVVLVLALPGSVTPGGGGGGGDGGGAGAGSESPRQASRGAETEPRDEAPGAGAETEPRDEAPGAGASAAVRWAIPADARRSTAVRVVDGDTLEIAGLGSSRLIGVDTPEVYGGRECFGPAASAFVERLVPPGAPLRYTLGRDPRDRYGRALVTVWLEDGRSVNALLVQRGYASTLTIAPNTRHASRLKALERRARGERRGLWGRCDLDA